MSIPSDSKWYLLGTKNIVGCYLNRVKAKDVCSIPAQQRQRQRVNLFNELIQARDLAGFKLCSKAVVAAFPSKI